MDETVTSHNDMPVSSRRSITEMTKGEALRDLTAAAIIDGAATLLAERGEAVSMEEIASSAGVGRATLYRYFPNRDELLKAMAAASVEELAIRVREAELETVPFQEAIARLARGIIATGSRYVAVSADSAKYSDTYPGFDAEVVAPIRALFDRAHAGGILRAELPPGLAMELFSGLIKAAVDATTSGRQGTEEAAAAVTSLFLNGVRAS
jgi:TetR/AcrR family transcriptional regulator, mexCD-oprJ operon repressor